MSLYCSGALRSVPLRIVTESARACGYFSVRRNNYTSFDKLAVLYCKLGGCLNLAVKVYSSGVFYCVLETSKNLGVFMIVFRYSGAIL